MLKIWASSTTKNFSDSDIILLFHIICLTLTSPKTNSERNGKLIGCTMDVVYAVASVDYST